MNNSTVCIAAPMPLRCARRANVETIVGQRIHHFTTFDSYDGVSIAVAECSERRHGHQPVVRIEIREGATSADVVRMLTRLMAMVEQRKSFAFLTTEVA